MEKRYTNFGQKYVMGDEIGEIIKIGMDMFMYSWSGRKKKTFSKNFILFSEVIRIKPMLQLNGILNQALLKDKTEEIGNHSRARPINKIEIKKHVYIFFK